MKILLALCFLVTFASIECRPESQWIPNHEYRYQWKLYTSVTAGEGSSSALVTRGTLVIRPVNGDLLVGNLEDGSYVHLNESTLTWEINEKEHVSEYSPMKLDEHPFEIELRNTKIHSISTSMKNTDFNRLKAILSLLQIDIFFPKKMEKDDTTATHYHTMEATVGGKCETIYELDAPVMEETNTWRPDIQYRNARTLYVKKTKDYTRCDERIEYFFDGYDHQLWNKTEKMMKRSTSKVTLYGNWQDNVVMESRTIDTTVIRPDENKYLMATADASVRLVEHKSMTEETVQRPGRLVKRGNLVYTYQAMTEKPDSSEEDNGNTDREVQKGEQRYWSDNEDADQESDRSYERNTVAQLPKQEISKAPNTPMLPYHIGNDNWSVTNTYVDDPLTKLPREIATDLENYKEIHRRGTLNKFNVLSSLMRTMNAEKLRTAGNSLTEHAWDVYRDALVDAGTGPSISIVLEWIRNKRMPDERAEPLIRLMPKTIREPSKELQKEFYNFATEEIIEKNPALNRTAMNALVELLHRVYALAHEHYPVHVYGRWSDPEESIIADDLIPYLERKIQDAANRENSDEIDYYIHVLKRLGHPKILAVFEPYLEGQTRMNDSHRWSMVMAMERLSATKPVIARRVFYRIYHNDGEQEYIRKTALGYWLLTKPNTTEILRLIEESRTEKSVGVRNLMYKVLEDIVDSRAPKSAEVVVAAIETLENWKNSTERETYEEEMEYPGDDERYVDPINMKIRAVMANFDKFAMISIGNELTKKITELNKEMNPNEPKATGEEQTETAKLLFDLLNNKHILEQKPHSLYEKARQWTGAKEEKAIDELRISNNGARVIAVPLETGLPLIYSQQEPMLMHINGTTSTEKNGDLLMRSDEIDILLSMSTEVTFSFLHPEMKLRHVVGYVKKMQMYTPAKSRTTIDTQKYKIRYEIESRRRDSPIPVYQLSMWPFVGRETVTALRPLEEAKDVHLMRTTEPKSFNFSFGQNETGIAWQLRGSTERTSSSNPSTSSNSEYDLRTFLVKDWFMAYSEMDSKSYEASLYYDPENSKTDRMVIDITHDQSDSDAEEPNYEWKMRRTESKHPRDTSIESENDAVEMSTWDEEKRRENVKRTPTDADTKSISVRVALEGTTTAETVATIVRRDHWTLPRSQILMHLRTTPPQPTEQNRPREVCVQIDANYNEADKNMRANTTVTSGERCTNPNAKKMTSRVSKNIETDTTSRPEGSKSHEMKMIEHVESAAISMDQLFHWQYTSLDLQKNDLEWPRRNHPTPIWQTRNKCVIDQSGSSTFERRSLPHEFGKCWHLAMETSSSHLKVSILVRDSQWNDEKKRKDVRIVMTQLNDKRVEVLMTPSRDEPWKPILRIDGTEQSPAARVVVIKDTYPEKGLWMKAFSKDGRNVTSIIDNGRLRIVYDGERVEIHADETTYETARGICGAYADRTIKDSAEKSKEKCTLRNDRDQVASWAVTEDGECEGHAAEWKREADRAECTQNERTFSDVIDERDFGARDKNPSSGSPQMTYKLYDESKCVLRYKTQVLRRRGHDEICFSKTPLPTCSNDCVSKDMATRHQVEIYCRLSTDPSALWYEREIHRGRNPNMSDKPTTRTVTFRVPSNCSEK